MTVCEYNIPDGYRQGRIQLEQIKLAETELGRADYRMTRNGIAYFAGPLIRNILGSGRMPQVLEVGGGVGNAIRRIIKTFTSHPVFDPKNITMTSLQALPEHADLITQGAQVETGIIIEDLPQAWENRFEVVMTSVVLQWARPDWAARSVAGVLQPDGIWIGVEMDYQSAEETATALMRSGCESVADSGCEMIRNIPGFGYLFAFRKPLSG